MKCPICMVAFTADAVRSFLPEDLDGWWHVVHATCPSCNRILVYLQNSPQRLARSPSQFKPPNRGELTQTLDELISRPVVESDTTSTAPNVKTTMVKPKGSLRPPCPSEVPKEIAEDYEEACLVFLDSPKASAALSRRCLQAILQAQGFTQYNLSKQIDEAIKHLPEDLGQQVDAVRNIGNFAAHPKKSQSTGEIVPVEPGEAEWNLDILEALFDLYYVGPATIQKKRQALDEKLKDIGQKPMKG